METSEKSKRCAGKSSRRYFRRNIILNSSLCAKMNEFLRLVQGTMTVAEYEKKYTELSNYALPIIANEVDRCKRFEEGLRREIRTLVIASSAEWAEFSKLVEVAMKVEKSLTKEKQKRDSHRSRRPI